MARLDIDRQKEFEPKRMDYAMTQLRRRGYKPVQHGHDLITFMYKGQEIKLFPYSGWHTGKTINDGRGIGRLLSQLEYIPR